VRSPTGEDLVSGNRAQQILGVSARTLRRYTAVGKLPDRRSPGGKRVFQVAELEQMMKPGRQCKVVLYARVSSRRQEKEGDLERQVQRLQVWAQGKEVAGVYKDVASGLADRRVGLHNALRRCQEPGVGILAVTHSERLARFGVETIRMLLAGLGVQLVVIGEDEALTTSPESDLVRDMLAVVTSFSGRLYGQRSAKAQALQRCLRKNLESPHD
jgi:predicted site-specific integrase-resolvase